jgi:hypothetical protein
MSFSGLGAALDVVSGDGRVDDWLAGHVGFEPNNPLEYANFRVAREKQENMPTHCDTGS